MVRLVRSARTPEELVRATVLRGAGGTHLERSACLSLPANDEVIAANQARVIGVG